MKEDKDGLLRKALILEYLTIAWNIFEGISCMFAGLISGSISLFAYGLESSVEVFASLVVVWDLKGAGKNREKYALKLIGVAYLIVSVYIFIDASRSLLSGSHASQSLFGLAVLLAAALAMMVLGLLKRDTGRKMGSATVLADAKFTLIDALLSTTVLVGLLFNFLFGWWWMDQAMALFLSGVAFREGAKELF